MLSSPSAKVSVVFDVAFAFPRISKVTVVEVSCRRLNDRGLQLTGS